MEYKIYLDDCVKVLQENNKRRFDISFLDPSFNQNKEYNIHQDNMAHNDYWDWMEKVCKLVFENTSDGGAIYFMQREKIRSLYCGY